MVGPEFDESALHFPLFKSNAGVPAPAVFNEMWRVRFGSEPNYQAAGSMAAMVNNCPAPYRSIPRPKP
jgi:hypothetical protein